MGKKTETPVPEPVQTAAEKLQPFLDIIASGEVPFVKIAELAGVEVEDVQAFVLALEPDPVEPPIEPPTDSEPAPSVVATSGPSPAGPTVATAEPTKPDAPEPPARPAASEVDHDDEPPAPETVRCRRKARVLGPDGKPWRIGTRDVYSGERARFLWRWHRELVEPYPPLG